MNAQVERTVLKSAVLLTLDHDVEEIQELALTAGYDILYVMGQKRSRPDPKTYLGKGKVKALRELLKERPVDAVILNGEAKPSHHYNLESYFKIVCVDRIRLILDIFATRANSREARLQVEKARLRYETPLLKEWIHNAKAGEHPGFMGGGEYAIDIYYDLVKSRMKNIEDELTDIRRDSMTRRKHRARKGLKVVSLAGYTNAGKSSLMRALTGETVLIEGRMFSTLSTTTRRMEGSQDILITDTIGFLKDLPHFLIESFRTTMEEIFTSDLVLLVVDSTEEDHMVEEKLLTAKEILLPKMDPSDVIIIFNKIDISINKNPNIILEEIVHRHFANSDIYYVSAQSGAGIEDLEQFIEFHFRYETEVVVLLPNLPTAQSLISYLYDIGEVTNIDYGEKVQIGLRCRDKDMKGINARVLEAGGVVKDLI